VEKFTFRRFINKKLTERVKYLQISQKAKKTIIVTLIAIKYRVIYDTIYLLTAIGLTPGGRSTVHMSVCLFSWRNNPLWLYFHSPLAGFSLLVFEVSRSHTTTHHSR
jgi:hypothetical protein